MLTILSVQINQDLCTRFGVQYYPTLIWASPPTVARGDRVKKTEELEEVKNAYSAEKLLQWINERIAKYVHAIFDLETRLKYALNHGDFFTNVSRQLQGIQLMNQILLRH